MTHSVGFNYITGDAASHLAKVVLEHAAMTEFCGIPLASLRENSITELNLRGGGRRRAWSDRAEQVAALCGGAHVAQVRPRRPQAFAFVSAPIDTAHYLPTEPHPRSLARNQLGPEGGVALAEGLKGNSMLQSLK